MDPEKSLLAAAAIEATKDIVPDVYKDGLQPTVKEIGKNLHTVSKLITVALTPISAMVWSYEKIKEQFLPSLEEKLRNVPEENIITPDPSIAVPIIEALRYTGHNDELREMFSNLLANSIDKETAPTTHPSFVEIIKQINSDEAKIIALLNSDDAHPIVKVKAVNKENAYYNEFLNNFSLLPFQAKCDIPNQGPSYLENIERLGLAEMSYETYVIRPNAYEPIYDHPIIKEQDAIIKAIDKRFELKKGSFKRSSYGKKFYESCILSKQ
ncbi:DUF4393 domain-containing protein [Bacillus sp. 03113]|uniref:DUF4393 domain-containing protein n=1 Tax=Bacillus sp. 03113 TaxID=2578211 RepID=UPI0011419145|nr:DUF4393 domain-containing protein [Bacillus sp. 03113]